MWVFRANVGLSDIYVLIFCYLVTVVHFLPETVAGGRKAKRKGKKSGGVEETEAIERLSRVFGIEHAPQFQVRAIPPQFMVELFNDITDAGGLIRKGGPYNASTVVSFPDRAYTQEAHFYYNVSKHSDERMLESEFHVFRIAPKPNSTRHTSGSRLSHVIEIKVYQVLDPFNMYSDAGRLLVDLKRVSAHARGWVIFNVTRPVREWVSGKKENHGFLVLSQTSYGDELGGDEIRFAQRKSHHDAKQPILVVYTNDGKERTPHYISPQDQGHSSSTSDSSGKAASCLQ